MKNFILIVVFSFFFLSGCSKEEKKEVTISAAASLQHALTDIKIEYEKKHDVSLVFNFGGSGTLATQIQQGAPVDLFFSASADSFDILEKKGLIRESTPLLGNSLVLITNKDNSFTSIKEANKIAMGTPGAVPAGTYAKQALEALNLWNEVKARIVQTKDVTQVLTHVETNNVDVGFVYKTDTLTSQKVKIVEVVDDSLHDDIIYPLGRISESKEAKDFYHFLQSAEAIAIFEKHGFTIAR